jgi:hypothetical protein
VSHPYNGFNAANMDRSKGSLSTFFHQPSQEDEYEMMQVDYPHHQPNNFLSLFDDGSQNNSTFGDNRFSFYGEPRYAQQKPQKAPIYCEPERYESNDDFFDTLPLM